MNALDAIGHSQVPDISQLEDHQYDDVSQYALMRFATVSGENKRTRRNTPNVKRSIHIQFAAIATESDDSEPETSDVFEPSEGFVFGIFASKVGERWCEEHTLHDVLVMIHEQEIGKPSRRRSSAKLLHVPQ